MHEYSIISALVERVAREAGAHPGAIVRRVHVRIGELAGVEPALLRTAFETCRARSVCDAADLELLAEPAAWRCPRCELAIAAGAVLRCPTCQRPAQLTGGGDIILERIELEVNDV